MKETAKLIKNKAQGTRDCEKVLGSETQVAIVANFYANNAELIDLIATDALIEYAFAEDYDSREIVAFRAGIGSMGAFMQLCQEEYISTQQERNLPPVPKD